MWMIGTPQVSFKVARRNARHPIMTVDQVVVQVLGPGQIPKCPLTNWGR